MRPADTRASPGAADSAEAATLPPRTASPAAATGQLRGLRTMGMSAMLVMDVAMIVMPFVCVLRHSITNDSCARRGVVVPLMSVIAVTVRKMSVIETRCRRMGEDRRQLRARRSPG